jgi:hypothetical protein
MLCLAGYTGMTWPAAPGDQPVWSQPWFEESLVFRGERELTVTLPHGQNERR